MTGQDGTKALLIGPQSWTSKLYMSNTLGFRGMQCSAHPACQEQDLPLLVLLLPSLDPASASKECHGVSCQSIAQDSAPCWDGHERGA